MMDEVYNWGYYESENYDDASRWEEIFARVAKRIVQEIGPRTVLDVGCSVGYLVNALRREGVEAYGVDISNAAIEHASEEVKPYLQVFSLLDEDVPVGVPKKFDLVTNVEVLEHIYEEDIDKAMEKLCSFSDHVLFSSDPADFLEETHVNVRLGEYWVKMFAKQGLYHDLNYDASYLSPAAMYFRRQPDMTLPRLSEEYEHGIRLLREEYPTKRKEYTFEIWFDEGEGCSGAPITKTQKDREFEWTMAVPAGTRRVQLVPAAGLHCVVENLFVTAAGHAAPVRTGAGKPVPPVYVRIDPTELLLFDTKLPGFAAQPLITIRAVVTALDIQDNAGEIAGLAAAEGRARALAEANEASLAEQERLLTSFHFLQRDHGELRESYDQRCNDKEVLQRDLADLQALYNATLNSTSWRLTKPLRGLMRVVKGGVRGVFMRVPGLRSFYERKAAERHLGKEAVRFNLAHFGTLEGNPAIVHPPQHIVEQQEKTQFSPLKFSIITPLYNTPENYLRQLIQSVIGQSYKNWELCLADGSDAAHAYVGRVVAEYAARDSRIKYVKLDENKGIVGNSNAAIEMATGDYIALLDHDDVLAINALFENRKAISENGAEFLYSDEIAFRENDMRDITAWNMKPDFSPDTLRGVNYICHLIVFKKSLLEKAGGAFREGFEGSQDYDLVLRLTEQANKVHHIPKILYHWRAHANSVAGDIGSKPYAIVSAQKALSAHLERVGLAGDISVAPGADSFYKISYDLTARPLVSIIIPNCNETHTLRTCIDSIKGKSTYQNYEIIICENNSTEDEIFEYYKQLEQDEKIRVITWEGLFNYSAINNFAVKEARGEQLIFLNNDTEVITEDWIEELLMFCQREDVGAAGAKLYYPDDTLQHGGVVLGIGGIAGHTQVGNPRSYHGYNGNLLYARNITCVTAACMMVRRDVFDKIGGFDEEFTVAFNDIDLCMCICKAGYKVIFTPFSELYHYESKSRGSDQTVVNQGRFRGEIARFKQQWGQELAAGDPFYNPNLTLELGDYRMDLRRGPTTS